MKVKEIMTRDVATCLPQDSLADAARVLWERDCGILPVVEPETRRVVGMLTDRDVAMAAYTQGRRLAEIPIAVAMSKNLRTCGGEQEVDGIHAAMREYQIRRLPVVDAAGRLAGIVSINDIALRAEATPGPVGRAMKNDVAETLAAVCRHRPLVVV
ncbi:MAG TPA: CBS domain-containing protein [Planctomycetota bacterium]|jgi:CBS domain-containing protein|nr:CBS domain-containing protein [Planctomycetota bacterium]